MTNRDKFEQTIDRLNEKVDKVYNIKFYDNSIIDENELKLSLQENKKIRKVIKEIIKDLDILKVVNIGIEIVYISNTSNTNFILKRKGRNFMFYKIKDRNLSLEQIRKVIKEESKKIKNHIKFLNEEFLDEEFLDEEEIPF